MDAFPNDRVSGSSWFNSILKCRIEPVVKEDGWISSTEDNVDFGWFFPPRVLLKKSGCKIPRIELEEMGPSLDLVMRRTHLASDDLFKLSLKQPKGLKVCTLERALLSDLSVKKSKGWKYYLEQRLKYYLLCIWPELAFIEANWHSWGHSISVVLSWHPDCPLEAHRTHSTKLSLQTPTNVWGLAFGHLILIRAPGTVLRNTNIILPLQPKKKKNISHDALGTTYGQIHMQKQDLSKLQTRKMKGLRKRPAEKSAEDGGASPKKSKSAWQSGTVLETLCTFRFRIYVVI